MNRRTKRVIINCKAIVEARESTHLSQQEVAEVVASKLGKAEMVDDPVQQHRRYENGEVNGKEGVTYDKRVRARVAAISQVLDLSVDVILSRTELPPNPADAAQRANAALAMLNRFKQWAELKNSLRPVTEKPVITYLLRAPREQLLHLFLERLAPNLNKYALELNLPAPRLEWVVPHQAGIAWIRGSVWLDQVLEAVDADPDDADTPATRLHRAAKAAPLFIVLGNANGLVLRDAEWQGLDQFLKGEWSATVVALKRLCELPGETVYPIRLLVPLSEPRNAHFWQRWFSSFHKNFKTLLAKKAYAASAAALTLPQELHPLDWPSESDLGDWLKNPALFSTQDRIGVFAQPVLSDVRIHEVCRAYGRAVRNGQFTDLGDIFEWLRLELNY